MMVLLTACGRGGNEQAAPAADEATRATYLAETVSIETAGDVASPLFTKGPRLPASRAETFSTATDGQPTFSVKLMVGEAAQASANRPFINVAVPLEHPGLRAGPQIDLTVKVQADGRVSIVAVEQGGRGRFERNDLLVAVDQSPR